MGLSPDDLDRLFEEWEGGDRDALSKLVTPLYDELHQLAGRYMRGEGLGHTLQTSALVNEAYLKLSEQQQINWQSRAHFLAIAAKVMRRILVDHARKRSRLKRGGSPRPLQLNEELGLAVEPAGDLVALNEALDALERFDPRKCRVVELRFFAGLSIEETAGVLQISANTVGRDWAMAKAWLFRELGPQTENEG